MLTIKELMTWIQSTEVGMTISQSRGWFPALEMIHVTATTFVFGMITIVDLRLLGLLARGSAVRDLYRDVIPLTWAAFVVAAITGILLFTGQAVAYSVNFAFQMKFAVLALIAPQHAGVPAVRLSRHRAIGTAPPRSRCARGSPARSRSSAGSRWSAAPAGSRI